MDRDIDALSGKFDVLVVGAGMHGVAITRLLAHAGFSTALVERDDFCSATSRNSAKLIHGGLRYMQHLDFARVRESAAAQREWRIASPNLVRPLRFVMPTRGWGARGPAALAAGIAIHQALTAGRNSGVAATGRLPAGGLISHGWLASEFPMLDGPGVSGGAHWHDAQVIDPGRFAIGCIEDAVLAGAVAANHVEAVRLLAGRSGVHGAVVRDRLGGRELEVRARLVIDATGPWTGLLARATGLDAGRRARLSRHVNLVTRRILPGETAIGVSSTYAADAVVGGARRLLFVSPWRDCSIVGTWHDDHDGDPGPALVTPHEIEAWVEEINLALPEARLRLEDVRSVHAGLIPVAADRAGRGARDLLLDHSSRGVPGLISVAGLKLTTAPTTARRVLRHVQRSLGGDLPRRTVTFARPLPGAGEPAVEPTGPTASLQDPLEFIRHAWGGRAPAVLASCTDGDLPPADFAFRCRALYAVRNEMAVGMSDVLFRATDDAERGVLTRRRFDWAAEMLAAELEWTDDRKASEIAGALSRLELMRPSTDRTAGLPGRRGAS